ncbi:MAG: hypothetical protein RLZZ536_794, partial [Planctomycetota bacterium]
DLLIEAKFRRDRIGVLDQINIQLEKLRFLLRIHSGQKIAGGWGLVAVSNVLARRSLVQIVGTAQQELRPPALHTQRLTQRARRLPRDGGAGYLQITPGFPRDPLPPRFNFSTQQTQPQFNTQTASQRVHMHQ